MTFAVAESDIEVLLVEPTGEDTLGLGEQLAEANESLTIHSVTDIGRARAVLRDTVVDCAVCVHDPPSIDGLAVLSAIRERTPELPVLLAVDTECSARSVLDTGATDVVSLIDGRIDRDIVTNRIENAVAGSRDRGKFEQVFEQATDGIAIHDPGTGAVLESNARLAELLGYDPDDPESVGIEEFAAGTEPYTVAEARNRIRNAVADGPATFEWLMDDGDEPTWVEISLKPATIVGRDCVLSFVRNVADRKEQERLLRDRQRQFEAVFDHPASFTTVLDTAGRVRRVNRPALDLIDAVEGDIEGRPFPETPWWAGDTDGRRRIREAIDTAAAGESTRLEIEVCGAAQEHVVDLSFQPVSDGDDTAVDSIIAVGYDITERKRRERALRESREALERLHRITADPDRSFEDQIDDLLAFGCSYLGTSGAFLSRIDEATDHFEIVRSHGNHPSVQPGVETDLGSTYCRHTIAADEDDTMTVADAAEEMADDPAYDAHGLGCYAGGEVHIDGELYGTLCFVDPDAREAPFSTTETTVINVIRQWLQYELERDDYRREIEETRDRLERILERVDDGFFALDDDWRITYANEEGATVLRGAMGANYDIESLLGRRLWDEIPEAVDTPFYRHYTEAMETQEPIAFEAFFEPMGRWFDVNTYPDEDGISVYFKDITNRKQRERILDDLLETTQEFVQSRTERELADLVVEATVDVLGYDSNIVRLHDADEGTLPPAALSDAGAERLATPPMYDADEGIAGQVFQSGESLLVDDLTAETEADYGPFRSAIVLPLGEHGTLGIGSQEPNDFDHEDVALAELLATTARVALDRIDRETTLRRFRRVVEHVEEMVLLLDPDGEFTFVTEPFADFLGYDRDELDERAFETVVSAPERERFAETLAALDDRSGERTVTFETTLVTASSDDRPVELALSTFPDEVEESGIVGTVTDIHELTETRAQLEVERDRFRHLFENLPDPVVEVEIRDGVAVVQHVNPAFAEVFGYDPDAIRGRALDELIVPAEESGAASPVEIGDETSVEAQRETPDGRRDFLIRGIPYHRDATQYGFGIYTDITDQKERERYLQVLNRVLRHNLRNDLNVIMLSAEWLVDRLDGELAAQARTLRDNANELAGLSEKAKEIERMIGRRGEATSPVDVVPVLHRLTERYRERYPEIDLSLDLPDSLRVHADDDITRVFEELVENAVVHNDGPSPTIHIDASTNDDWVTVRLHDDASGIPDDEWRVVTGEREITQLTHSSGLGLWLVRWVIDSYGGEVRRRGTDDGTTIELRLRSAAPERLPLDGA
ncbi:PAS domain S-box protein [Haloplanus natans]|uniref:PAS domain S-box protein n=1 Tax=Haloplanus natans TaxID=376171 RepID=UPI000677CE74|nr:PAS domain S-box protein [Haloplanus natans]